MGKLDQALADRSRALTHDPDSAPIHMEMARLLAALGRNDAALASIGKAITLQPREAHFALFRGALLKRFGRSEEAQQSLAGAVKLLDEALKLQPEGTGTLSAERAALLSQKIHALSMSGQHKAALQVAHAALAVQPDNIAILTERCRARVAASTELNLARRDCDLAVNYEAEDIATRLSRGLLRLKTANWDAAIADYDVALRIEPQEPHALYGRGLAKLRKGDPAGSKRDFEAARRYSYDVDAQYEGYGLKP
jgi:tetratricopeptide (TPR) repeat protein